MSSDRSTLSGSRRAATARPSRRSFLKLGIGGAALPLGPMGGPRAQPFGAINWLDGEYRVDEVSRNALATDFGGAVRRLPRAAARPRSVEDIARIVAYANGSHIKVTMRGQGHSLSGQSQIDDGIVIDSGSLNAVACNDDNILEVEAGALWGNVAKAGLARGRLPAVMPDAMMLSVGGTLSVGGIGETSFRHGAQVDHVLSLDVVTGAGELVTCSAGDRPELFHMTLAGLGQCGIIVRARLRTVATPRHIVTHMLTYRDLDRFLADQARLVENGACDLLNGRLNRTAQGAWEYALFAGRHLMAEDASDTPGWIDGLSHGGVATSAVTPIWSHLDRRTASIMAGKAKALPNPSLVLTLPAGATKAFITELLASGELSSGIWFFEVSPKVPARHRQPLQKMPTSALAYELRMQRRASARGAADHHAMLSANAVLVATAMRHGGKVYPPFAPILSAAQWQEHFGPATWTRFAAAKRMFDPNTVLNTGAGIF
jgi:FAD/FMN-containing dehydrogenase